MVSLFAVPPRQGFAEIDSEIGSQQIMALYPDRFFLYMIHQRLLME